jgi:hypothetical protein
LFFVIGVRQAVPGQYPQTTNNHRPETENLNLKAHFNLIASNHSMIRRFSSSESSGKERGIGFFKP